MNAFTQSEWLQKEGQRERERGRGWNEERKNKKNKRVNEKSGNRTELFLSDDSFPNVSSHWLVVEFFSLCLLRTRAVADVSQFSRIKTNSTVSAVFFGRRWGQSGKCKNSNHSFTHFTLACAIDLVFLNGFGFYEIYFWSFFVQKTAKFLVCTYFSNLLVISFPLSTFVLQVLSLVWNLFCKKISAVLLMQSCATEKRNTLRKKKKTHRVACKRFSVPWRDSEGKQMENHYHHLSGPSLG